MSAEIAIRKYEDFILGKSSFSLKGPSDIEKQIDTIHSKSRQRLREERIKDAKEEDALAVVRYAITELLGWTPQEAMDSLNKEIIEQLKLDKIQSYIQYPKDLNKNEDYAWMVHKAFPEETTYDPTEQVLTLYNRLKNGEIKRFPKKIFSGDNGAEKLAVLLHHYITQNIPTTDLEYLYEVFGNTANMNKEMHEANLYYAYKDMYDTPLEYLHESLGEDRDDFLYEYYQYMSALKEVKKG